MLVPLLLFTNTCPVSKLTASFDNRGHIPEPVGRGGSRRADGSVWSSGCRLPNALPDDLIVVRQLQVLCETKGEVKATMRV